MKALVALVIGMACAFAPAGAIAQSDTGAEAAPAAQPDETIVVTGRRDRALDAFLRGDFVTAEEEFRNNLRCIQRVDRQREASIEQAVSDSITASMLASVGAGGEPLSLMQSAGHPPQIYNTPANVHRIAERTCHSPEWQLYMVGLSQIQQGELTDARHSLTLASRSRDELMFDAHFRIGLIDLMNGDVDRAERSLLRLNALQRNCDMRGARCEVHAELDAATSYLRSAIRAERRAR